MTTSHHSIPLWPFAVLTALHLFAIFAPVHIPEAVFMLTCAVLCIYVGSHGSVPDHLKVVGGAVSVNGQAVERMESKDAYKFPVVGSIVLFSLYCLVKFLPPEWLEFATKTYFSLISVFALWHLLTLIVRGLSPNLSERFGKPIWSIPSSTFPLCYLVDSPKPKVVVAEQKEGEGEEESEQDKCDESAPASEDIEISTLDIPLLAISIAAAVYWFLTEHWAVNNVFGMAFSIEIIMNLHLGSYQTAAILLSGLFVYDVFWVFGTEVMVTVAKNINGPIKLLFPRVGVDEAGKQLFSMLGLGDIALPGALVSMMLRFDYVIRGPAAEKKNGGIIDAFFFHVTLIGYIAGLVATVMVMYFFNAAQPALLYLVPSCLGSSLLAAAVKGRLQQLISFNEEEHDGEKEKEA